MVYCFYIHILTDSSGFSIENEMNFSLLKRHENNAFCVNINMWRRNGVVYAANKSVSLSLCIFCIIKKHSSFCSLPYQTPNMAV